MSKTTQSNVPEYYFTMTRCPLLAKALGSDPTTSPSPPAKKILYMSNSHKLK